jgi:hypothetical protein
VAVGLAVAREIVVAQRPDAKPAATGAPIEV